MNLPFTLTQNELFELLLNLAPNEINTRKPPDFSPAAFLLRV